MPKTLIRNKDVAANAGILTDKLEDAAQNNQFLDPIQKTDLTTGVNADAQHWHSAFGAISAQFGRNAIVAALGGNPQYLEAAGVPTSLSGILMARNGQILSVSAAVAEAVASDCVFQILADGAILTSVTVLALTRKAFVIDCADNFDAGTELKCRITQGQAKSPSVLVEFRWR